MSADTVALVAACGAASISAVGSIIAAFIARRSERNTRPISNGFAGHVKESLGRVEDRLGLIERGLIDHLTAHTNGSVNVHVQPPDHPPTQGDPS